MSAEVTTLRELTTVTQRRRPAGVDIARRALDVTVPSAVLLMLVPIVLAVMLAVRLNSPGPVLFRQRRLGRGMRPFTVLKFRTMHADADSALHREYVHTPDRPGPRARGARRAVQARRRSARHARGALPALVEPRRGAAAVERPARRDEPRGAAARHRVRGRAVPRLVPAPASRSSPGSPACGRSAGATSARTRR